jgi:hypothetical protein
MEKRVGRHESGGAEVADMDAITLRSSINRVFISCHYFSP